MSENNQKNELIEFIYKNTSLENIASIFVLYVTALYRLSLLVLLLFSIFVLFSDGFVGIVIALVGYVLITLMFGLTAIFVQIHEHLKNLAEK